MICTFIVGISHKWESVILILILFGTYAMYIMVYKSSNYKQWPGIVFWYSQIQNPVQTKIKTLKYFNYITLSSTDLFFLQLFDYIYVCLYIWKQSTRQALLLKRKIYFRWFYMNEHHWLCTTEIIPPFAKNGTFYRAVILYKVKRRHCYCTPCSVCKREKFVQFNISLNYVYKYPISIRYC